MYNPQDYYFKKAKQAWFKARSAFKLEEINDKFHLFTKDTKTVLDIGCSPGSRLQFAYAQTKKFWIKNPKLLWFDIKTTDLNLPWIFTYKQDVTQMDEVRKIIADNKISWFDLIQSDMAPNTIGLKDIDAIRSIDLLTRTLWIYKEFLKPEGKFVIKIFMWPGFEEFVRELKNFFWWKNIKIFKPKASRSESKETYIIKI